MSNHRSHKSILLHHRQKDNAQRRKHDRELERMFTFENKRKEARAQALAWYILEAIIGLSLFIGVGAIVANAIWRAFR